NQNALQAVLRKIANAFKNATAEPAASPRASVYKTNLVCIEPFFGGLKPKTALWLSIAEPPTLEKAILGARKIEAREYYNSKRYEPEVEKKAFDKTEERYRFILPRSEILVLLPVNMNPSQPISQALVVLPVNINLSLVPKVPVVPPARLQ
ncbi:27341_t:CDS:2, partial [Racocetra persica]